MEGVVSFPQSPHLLSIDVNNCRNRQIMAAVPWSYGLWFDETEPQKEGLAAGSSSWYWRRAWTPKITSAQRHMIPLGLAPGIRTQAPAWWRQHVHHCANAFVAVTILWVLSPTSTRSQNWLKCTEQSAWRLLTLKLACTWGGSEKIYSKLEVGLILTMKRYWDT